MEVTISSNDSHYNSSANLDPAAISGYTIPVRCHDRPRVDAFDPPASHMQGGSRVRILGKGLRTDLAVWFSSTNDLATAEPASCTDVVVLSDEEARCTLPSSQCVAVAVSVLLVGCW